MQLFSIGIYELDNEGRVLEDAQGNPIATYTNEDITEMARVFTGLGYAGAPQIQGGAPNYRTFFCFRKVE